MSSKQNSLSQRTCIGFLGNGQLAQMSARCATEMGFQVRFSDARPTEAQIEELVQSTDVVTLENEFISVELLSQALAKQKKKCVPDVASFEPLQSKYYQKELFSKYGLTTVQSKKCHTVQDVIDFGLQNGFPFILKKEFGAYDGYGNKKIEGLADCEQAFSFFKGEALYAESFAAFARELAFLAVRSQEGDIKFYPVVETIQKNHICHKVRAYQNEEYGFGSHAEGFKYVKESLAKLLDGIQYVGIFALECFQLDNGNIIANECAPRPHNSGHYTQNACKTSQFENHVRAVLGLPLGSTDMVVPVAGMWNVLGAKQSNSFSLDFVKDVCGEVQVWPHFYGKLESRVGRKMGHLNYHAFTHEDLVVIEKTIDDVWSKTNE